jgi:hypothetical protein
MISGVETTLDSNIFTFTTTTGSSSSLDVSTSDSSKAGTYIIKVIGE